MTLLAEIQSLLERTYQPVGVNLEECLIGQKRRSELAGLAGIAWSDFDGRACTFLRQRGDALGIAIYYAPEVVATLEREDPRRSISHRNIACLIAFIEEITHGVHAALGFLSGVRLIGREQFLCNLELQGKIDVYYTILRLCALMTGVPVTEEIRVWVRARLFDDDRFDYTDTRLAKRYRLAHRLAQKFIERTDALPPKERGPAIRAFRELTLLQKARHLNVR